MFFLPKSSTFPNVKGKKNVRKVPKVDVYGLKFGLSRSFGARCRGMLMVMIHSTPPDQNARRS